MTETIKPVRLRLSRRRGFSLQALSLATNGLTAVNVARPGKWGNPYRIGSCFVPDARSAVEAFAANLPMGDEWALPLRGKNLACWCGPADACHADILLCEANPARPALDPSPLSRREAGE